MRTILRKLLGASAGAGAVSGFFVLALVGLIAGLPSTAHAGEVTGRYLRFTGSQRAKAEAPSGGGMAISEFRVTLRGADVTPAGVQAVDFTAPRSGNDAAHLYDGVYSPNGSNNRYWTPETNSDSEVTFTYDFGAPVTFDGYLLSTADYAPRNPWKWKLEVSDDKSSWTVCDSRAYPGNALGFDLLGSNTTTAFELGAEAPAGTQKVAAGSRGPWRRLLFRTTKVGSSGQGLALGEFWLTDGGRRFLPSGTTIQGTATTASTTVWGNIINGAMCVYSSNQKGWATAGSVWWVTTFPEGVSFDGYGLQLADHGPRNPVAWEVWVSDGTSWLLADTRDFGTIAAASAYFGAGNGSSTNARIGNTYPSRDFSLASRASEARPTGRSVNFALGACGSLGADLTGPTLYGIAPYQAPGSAWNNLAPTSTAQGGSLTVSTVRDSLGATVEGATFAVSGHGAVASITTATNTRTDTTTTPDYCLLPSGSDKMAVFKENSAGEDSFVFTGVPYRKFAVVLYLGQSGVTADGHDYVTVTRTYFNGMSSSGSDKTYSTKYTYVDGKLTIVDGEKIKDGSHNVGIWGNPEINWSNAEGDGVMVLPNQEADKNGAYTFRLSQKNNNGSGASWRSMFRAVSFVEVEDTWHEPLREDRGSVGFVLGDIGNGKGDDWSPTAWYGLNGYALPGAAWNRLTKYRTQTLDEVRDRFGETVEGMAFASTGLNGYDADMNANNVRVLPPFEFDTPYFQDNVKVGLTGVPYRRYTAILYLNREQGWYNDRTIRQVTVTADGEEKNYTYVGGVLASGDGTWGYALDNAATGAQRAGIVGLEGVGVMVLHGLTAKDIAFQTNGGNNHSQFQGLQIVEETEADRVAREGVRMLHRFDFEDTMTVGGSKERVAPVDKGAGGHAFPVVSDANSNDTIPVEGRFGSHALASCYNTNGIGVNSDGFKLRNVMGLGCDAKTGFTLSAFLKLASNITNGRSPMNITLGDPANADDRAVTVRFQKWTSGGKPIFSIGAFKDQASTEINPTWTEGGSPFLPDGWAHVAVVVRPAAESLKDASGNPCLTLDVWLNGAKAGTAAFHQTSPTIPLGNMVLKEFLVGRGRSNTAKSDDGNNSGYATNPENIHLDEVALFDRPLSEEGIAWLAENEAAVPPSETAMTEWAALPAAHADVGVGNWTNFRVRFGGTGVRHVGALAPAVPPESAELRGATVRWGMGGGNNVTVRRLVLVDAAGKVAAVSGLTRTFAYANNHCSTYFPFPEGTTVDFAEDYKGYFVGDNPPAVGSAFDESAKLSVRYLTFAGATAEGGLYVEGNTAHAPHIAFTFWREPVSSAFVDGASVNVSFGPAGRLAADGAYGVVPFLGSAWNTVSSIPASPVAVTDSKGAEGIAVSAAARVLEEQNAANHPLLRDALEDNYASPYAGASVTLTGIPYETYDAYVYMTANAWDRNGSVTVNGGPAYYHMPEGAEAAATASANTPWGDARPAAASAPVLGVNVMRIAGLSGADLTLTAHRRQTQGDARGNIAAVQIVERREVEATAWVGTVRGDVASDALRVVSEDGTRTAMLSELCAADTVTLTAEAAATLTVAAPLSLARLNVQGVGTLTLAGHTLTLAGHTLACEAAGVRGTLLTSGGALAAKAVSVEAGAVFGFAGDAAQAFAGQIVGQGSVRVAVGAEAVLTNAESTYSGGTEVLGTLRWHGAGTLGTGAAIVRTGGAFDLNGLPCDQAVTLDGGALANTVAPREAFLYASANFNAGAAGSAFRLGDAVVDGLLPTAGLWWSNQTTASGTASLTAVPAAQAAEASGTAATRTLPDALSWSASHWAPNNHTHPFMNGYLDDGANKWAQLAVPADLAAAGYDVYLYSNTDSNGTFAARDVVGDDGATVSYTYANGALVSGSTAGWGRATERSALEVGTNVMVLAGRTDRTLKVLIPNRNGRGCLAAVQVGFRRAAYTGALTVRSASTLRGAEGAPLDLWGAAVSGTGDLSAEGAVALSSTALGTRRLTAAAGTLTLGPGNGLASAQLEVAAGATASAQAGLAALELSGVSGAGTLDLGGLAELTLTGAYGNAAHTGTVAGGAEGLAVTKRGAALQTFAALPAGASVSAEAGTLEVASAPQAGTLTLTGGTFAAAGGTVAHAEMTRGSVTLTAAGTAAAAKPAMVGPNDATVSRFTLAEGGIVRYDTKDDLLLYFPKGFVPYREAPYKLQLGTDLADELTFPVTFTVLGADPSAAFELVDADGNAVDKTLWGASGSTVTLNGPEAVTGGGTDLPAPDYHWAFDGNLNLADDSAKKDVTLSPEGVGDDSYEASPNGQAFVKGTPYGGPTLGSGEWTLTAFVSLRDMAANATLLGVGHTASAGSLALVRGTGSALALLHKPGAATTAPWTRLLEVPLAGDGDSWHFVALVRSPKYLKLYVDGTLAGTAEPEGTVADVGLQIGKTYGGQDPYAAWGASPGAVDDIALYPKALRAAALAQALAKVAATWRWHEASAPETLFDPAAADWADALGALGLFDPNDGTLTAHATLLDAATLEALYGGIAGKGILYRELRLSGEAVAHRLPADLAPVTLPEGAQRVFADNALTLDLGGAHAALTARWLAGGGNVKVADGHWTGGVTLRDAPEGAMVSAVAGDDGIYLNGYMDGARDWDWAVALNLQWDGLSANSLYGPEGYRLEGSKWNHTPGTGSATSSAAGITVSNLRTSAGETLSGSAVNVRTKGNVTYTLRSGYWDLLLKGVAEGPARYTFSGLPAGNYELLVYFSWGSAGTCSPIKTIGGGGTYYYSYDADGALQRTEATEGAAVPGGWGQINYNDQSTTALGCAIGKNTIKVPVSVGADGTLVVEVSDSANPTLGPGLGWQTASGRGMTAGIGLYHLSDAAAPVYVRTVSGEGAWSETGAWRLADGTVAPEAEPPEGAVAIVTAEADAVLTVARADVRLKSLRVFGGGTLTLRYDASAFLTEDDYRAIPSSGTDLTLLSAENDPDRVRVWLDGLRYGAFAEIARTASGATARLSLPESLYPDRGLISVNFWDATKQDKDTGGKLNLSGTSTAGYEGYNARLPYWAQPDNGAAKGTIDLKSVPFRQRTEAGATVTVLPGALTWEAYTTWSYKSNRGLLSGFLNDRPLGKDTGKNANLRIAVPEGWTRYTALVYGSVNSGSLRFTPRKVNGAWYTYVDGALQRMETPGDPGTGEWNPGEEGLWGSNATRNDIVEGENLMIVPGLSGDFLLEWYVRLSSGTLQDRGPVAAIQLVQEAEADLGKANAWYAKVSGATPWAEIAWADSAGTPKEGAPGENDTAILTLEGDAEVSFAEAVSVASLQVYGNGHAVAFHDRANLTAGEWAFLNDTTLALASAEETLPESLRVAPRRVRYDYAYAGDFTTSSAHETEFAAGYSGTVTAAGGLTEFSGGEVSLGALAANATETAIVLSGTARVTGADVSMGTLSLTLRDKAALVTPQLVLCTGGGNRTSVLTVEDDASVTVTGTNTGADKDMLMFGHWAGYSAVTLRDNARFVAEKSDLVLYNGNGDATNAYALTLEDDALMRVGGLSTRHGTNPDSQGDIYLRGGRLLIGAKGLTRATANRTARLRFEGGAFGAWQDVALGADAEGVLSVAGDPVFACEGDAELTLTRPAPFAADASRRLVFREGKVRLEGTAFAALPSLETAGGTLTLACSATVPRLRLHGGRLHLEGGFPVAEALVADAATVVRVPLTERLSEGGYLAMARNGRLPDLGKVVFELALDPDRPANESILPRVPLVLGSYAEGAEPSVGGLSVLNNANGALSDWEAILANGDAGTGLYVALEGNEVLRGTTAELRPGKTYTLTQSVANGWPFVTFRGNGPDSLLNLPSGGLALPHATFAGSGPIRIVAPEGTEPHVLLRGVGYTFSTDVTFDLSAWRGSLETLLSGAVRDVPASLCLVSGGVVKAPASVRLAATWGEGADLPLGFTGSVETTPDGVYYVVRADRRTRAVSANFGTAAAPLSAPPAAPGAYGVPVTAWNDLVGAFSTSALRLSDAGGGFSVPAASPEGTVTQLLAYGTQTGSDAAAAAPMLRAWMGDSSAQTLRITNVPFERWRLALVFSNDLEGAQWAAVTVNGSRYAMDAEGYVRRDVLPYEQRNVPGDEQWGSTDRTEASAPTVLGRNVLVTDTLSGDVTLELPAFTYARRYAGLAALQLLEAPAPADLPDPIDFAHTFAEDGTFDLADLTLTGGEGSWVNGAENTLTLTCDHDVTLRLPAGFEAARIVCVGTGRLTLSPSAPGAGVALGALNAARMADVTVGFPLLGVPFSPAQGVSRFEAPFDNAGEAYRIARGATLALGRDSGITTGYDAATSPLLAISADSAGTLRRDYPVTQTATVAAPNLTFAFAEGNVTVGTDNSTYSWLVEEGDTVSHPGKYHLASTAGTWSYTQTGGVASFSNATAGEGGILLFNNAAAANSEATLAVSGGRLEAAMVSAWRAGAHVEARVSGEGTLALGAGGLRAQNADCLLDLTLSEKGTLEATAATLPKDGPGTVRATLEGGRLTTAQTEAALTLPLAFAAGTEAPTEAAPEPLSTLTLSAANSGSGALTVTQGTLATDHGQGLGAATVTVRDGATFEARGFRGGSGGETTGPDGRSISLNILGGYVYKDWSSPGVAISGRTGLVPTDAAAWNNIFEAKDSSSDFNGNNGRVLSQNFKEANSRTGQVSEVSLTVTGYGKETTCLDNQKNDHPNLPTTAAGSLVYGGMGLWIASGNKASAVLVERIPYDTYDVYVYQGSRGDVFSAVSVNGAWYKGDGSATVPATVTGTGNDRVAETWGDGSTVRESAGTVTFAEGRNVICVRGLSGPLTVRMPHTGAAGAAATEEENVCGGADAGSCFLAGIQIVNATVDTDAEPTVDVGDAASGTVRFEAGSTCSATTGSTPALPYTARIASSIAFPDGKDRVAFMLNGDLYDGAKVQVSESLGSVTFTEEARIVGEDVTWAADAAEGVWKHGGAGPWADDKTFLNGAGVTFGPVLEGEDTRARVSVEGAVRPGALTFTADENYDFLQGAAYAHIDASALGATVPLGAGLAFDVPIFTETVGVTLQGIDPTVRLVGVRSDGGKTASLVGSGNVGGGTQGTHGVWHPEGMGDLTLSPHAGETQRLSPFGTHLRGDGDIIVAGQTAADGSVSGGTVALAGYTAGTNWNASWTGAFKVRDGATLDFAMTREYGANGDEQAYFRPDGNPSWDNGRVGIELTNGATLRFSGCRGIPGGWSQRDRASLIQSQPIVIGRDCRAEYSYLTNSNGQQYTPYGFRMNGDGATLYMGDGAASGKGEANRGLFLARGASVIVAGVGDAGDPSDPKTDTATDEEGAPANPETYGRLTEGITAYVDAAEGSGLVRWSNGVGSVESTGVNLVVGTNSVLRVRAGLDSGSAARSVDTAFVKSGAGRLLFEAPTVATKTPIRVLEGALGGTAEFTNADTSVTVASGAGIEAGLTVPTLSLGAEATLFLDPTGASLLRTGRTMFVSGGRYRVELLPGLGEIPPAEGLAPVKVMAWESSGLAGSAVFEAGEGLRAKGYGLEVRSDGLYVMRRSVYVRQVAAEDAAKPAAYALSWYADASWRRLGEAEDAPLHDYDPSDGEAVTALFVVPQDWVTDGVTVPITLMLNREVAFASVAFVGSEDFAANGADATPVMPSAVYYQYDLSQAEMPGEGETRSFTWVPSLVVGTPADISARLLAYVTVSDLPGYTVSVSERTVVVYTAAARPVLNVNFTARAVGDPSWIGSETEPCGAVPFAGVYWNNASPVDLLASDGTRSAFSHRATLFGVEPDAEGRAPTAQVTFVSKDPVTVASRRGTGNAGLAAGFLPGEIAQLPAELLSAAGMDASLIPNGGWRVRVDSIPFEAYDLYLIFAGAEDRAVTYSPVYLKVGTGKWHAYGFAGGWATTVWRNDLWQGQGGLVEGGFASGANVLHLRVEAAADAGLEIAAIDYGNDDAPNGGLAALQIVRCDDGATLRRVGAGKWSDALGWQRRLIDGTATGAWQDATDAAPRAAVLPTVSSLTADRAAAAPLVRMEGSATLSGTAGALAVPSLDLSEMPANTAVTFANDVFAEPPMVHLAPEVSFTLPEGGRGTVVTNDWRWLYDKNVLGGADVLSATLRKRGAGDLVIARKYEGQIRIDDGTLWLSTATDGAYERSAEITGDGIFGKLGSGDLEIPWNSLRTSGAAGVLAQAKGGVLYLNASNGSLPAGQTVEAVENGTVVFQLKSGDQRRPFNKGIIRARAGGRIILRNATNLFTEGENRPRLVLEDGMYQNDLVSGGHYHLYSLVSRGLSAMYMNAEGTTGWTNQGLNLWDGTLKVEDGTLALWPNVENDNNFLYIRGVSRTLPDGSSGNGGAVDVAAGAEFYSNYAICMHNGNNNRNNYKLGGGVWVQTRSIANRKGDNGSSQYNGSIFVCEGTLRWNLGTNSQNPNVDDRTLQVWDGARMDGAGRIQKTNVTIRTGGTLASGLPKGWAGIDRAHRWYASLPDRFKGEAPSSIGKLRIDSDLSFQDDAILEVSLANIASGETLPNALDVDGTVSFGKTLTVRLKDLPATVSAARRLTDFANAPTGTPKITCPEAIALGSEVVLRDGNLWLEPTFGGYVWESKDGDWASAGWATNGIANLAIPYARDAAAETTPTARVVASSADVALAVTKPGLPTVDEGAFWGNQALVLSAVSGRTATLTQGSTDADKPNGLTVATSLWKIGDGTAVAQAPLRFAGLANSGNLNVSGGTLTLALPLSKESVDTTYTAKNHLPERFAVEIGEGATLRYALDGSATADALGFDPMVQTLAGPVTGAGTLAVDADGATLTLTGTADSDLGYDVRKGTLRLAGDIAASVRSARRVAAVAAGARLELMAAGALGWTTDRVIRLEAADGLGGARVATASDARVRGRVEVTAAAGASEPVATLGTGLGAIDGDLAFDVPAGARLDLGGSWQTPSDATSGALTKTGAGTLRILGEFRANLPMTVAEGKVVVGDGQGTGLIGAMDNNAATVADWTVAKGAALEFADTQACDLNGGTLTVATGGELWLSMPAAGSLAFASAVAFEDGAVLRAGTNEKTLTGMRIDNTVSLRGIVTVDLDALDPATFSQGSAQSSYPILTFGRTPTGSGSFVLGGKKLVEWARAGWTLRFANNELLLESFGGTEGYYAWEGKAGDVWGTSGAWVKNGTDTPTDWPSANTGSQPAALFADRGHDGAEIPAAARTVDWQLPAQTLAALRVDNDLPGDGDDEASHDYTLTATGAASPQLTVAGDLLKTGSAGLTVRRPVSIGTEGALRLLGGTTVFASSLASSGGVLTKPVTLAGGAALVFEGTSGWTLSGLIDGDGTGTVTKRYGGSGAGASGLLTLASDLSSVASLTAEDGTLALSAPDQFALAPTVALGPSAMLSQAGAFAGAGDVTMRVNAEPDAEGALPAPQGIFQWAGTSATDSARAPRLAAPADLAQGPALNVAEFRHAPAAGHLILDPGHAVLPATAALTLSGAEESKALWMGARTDAGTDFGYAAVSGLGILGVEPVIDPFSDAVWATNRVLTLTLAPTAEGKAPAFRGSLMGALTVDGTAIRAGLALRGDGTAPAEGAAPRFVLAGASTDAYLGALTLAEGVRAEVNGVWGGDAAVAKGATLAGSGTVGAPGRTVSVPAGATLSGAVYGDRPTGAGTTRPETIPSTLSVEGTLRMDMGSRLKVLVRKNLVANNAPWVSCVEADALVLPSIVAGGTRNDVELEIALDIEDGAYASDVKILGWKSISGARITGRITVNGEDDNKGYVLRQKGDGLYLRRSNARFWMMFR